MHGLEIRVVRTVLSSLDEPRSGKRCGLVQVVKVKVDSYLHTKSDLYVLRAESTGTIPRTAVLL